MVASVCFDVVFCFVDLTIVSLLSYTGLPSNCSGLITPTGMKARRLIISTFCVPCEAKETL